MTSYEDFMWDGLSIRKGMDHDVEYICEAENNENLKTELSPIIFSVVIENCFSPEQAI